jgi:hypothetical protein
MDTTQKLDALVELYAERDALELHRQELIDAVYTAEIKAKIADINAELSEPAETVTGKIALLEAEIKADVLVCGETVKGAHMMAVYAKGRVTWDNKKLDGMMALIPALKEARKEGEPSVSLRKA